MSTNSTDKNQTLIHLLDRVFMVILYLLPHHLLSRVMHWLTRCEWKPLKNGLISAAIALFKIDMSIAKDPNPRSYPNFNAFFTRALKREARPLEQENGAVISPVDGTISQLGDIEGGRIFQAKGHDYSLSELLGGDESRAELFQNGKFATIYLSPRDYHRIHMPCSGVLDRMTHVPGRLFSVSPSTTRTLPGLFSRNERVINYFDTDHGPMAVIMVGAIFVASMDTVWAGTVTPIDQRIGEWDYRERQRSPVTLDQGDEMGRFNMGSTVILLFPEKSLTWNEDLAADSSLRMGQALGQFRSAAHTREEPETP